MDVAIARPSAGRADGWTVGSLWGTDRAAEGFDVASCRARPPGTRSSPRHELVGAPLPPDKDVPVRQAGLGPSTLVHGAGVARARKHAVHANGSRRNRSA